MSALASLMKADIRGAFVEFMTCGIRKVETDTGGLNGTWTLSGDSLREPSGHLSQAETRDSVYKDDDYSTVPPSTPTQ